MFEARRQDVAVSDLEGGALVVGVEAWPKDVPPEITLVLAYEVGVIGVEAWL